MGAKKFQYLYGPVYSWRLGVSLGIDPISQKEKICNYDCTYCQLGATHLLTRERKIYVKTEDLLAEISRLDDEDMFYKGPSPAGFQGDPSDKEIKREPQGFDYLTFSGRGEPTLALNLGEMIDSIKKVRDEAIAVITNGGLLDNVQVRQDLNKADCVLVKMDACDADIFEKVNCPAKGSDFSKILDGISDFRKEYRGKLCLQIMFIEANQDVAQAIADQVRSIDADEVELNTPLRRCSDRPLSEQEMIKIKECFVGIEGVTMVYERERKKIASQQGQSVRSRHGKLREGEG